MQLLKKAVKSLNYSNQIRRFGGIQICFGGHFRTTPALVVNVCVKQYQYPIKLV